MKTKATTLFLVLSILLMVSHANCQTTEQEIISFQDMMESSHSNYYDVVNRANQFFEQHPDLLNEDDGVYADFVRWKLF